MARDDGDRFVGTAENLQRPIQGFSFSFFFLAVLLVAVPQNLAWSFCFFVGLIHLCSQYSWLVLAGCASANDNYLL